jgi:hypothetical protein
VIVVGAIGDALSGFDPGSAYVFRYQAALWVEESKLVAADGNGGDSFGFSVAVSGDQVLIGAPLHDHVGSDSGGSYMFTFDGVSWSQTAEVLSSDLSAGDQFGYSVDLRGAWAVMGAPLDGVGSAYLFLAASGSWEQRQKVTISCCGDFFGGAVAIADESLVIMALPYNLPAAHTYRLFAGTWEPSGGDIFDYYASADVDDVTAVIGAPTDQVAQEGWAHVLLVPELLAWVVPGSAVPHQFVTVGACGGFGGFIGLAAVALDGMLIFLFLGTHGLQGNLPPGLSGHVFSFQAFTMSPTGSVVSSNLATLTCL